MRFFSLKMVGEQLETDSRPPMRFFLLKKGGREQLETDSRPSLRISGRAQAPPRRVHGAGTGLF